MTSLDTSLTYAAFCGSLLDDMLDQVIFSIISRSLLDEKLIRKDYGTIEKPVFHDTPAFTQKFNNEKNGNNNSNGRIDLTLEDDDNEILNSKNISVLKNKLPSEPDIGRFQFTLNGKDVYVNALNDNKKLLGSKANSIVMGTAQDTYFKCSNCDRKIAGSRFSAHVDKCLGGRSRK
ncbi:hypothetical protein C6P40_004185 [Pichia californica]|uniref:SAGA-associated factor 11 n=1 Tax=Pichia californica TaxID=460514 RepID=A0A9P7BH20_9ASCO|nr:hypothetical protein C6P42_004783 [[Candida] californica]KAG0689945.1 hypothetical protein C6P40_004185 [[Candida] californica]